MNEGHDNNYTKNNHFTISNVMIVLTAIWPTAGGLALVYRLLTYRPLEETFSIMVSVAVTILLATGLLYLIFLLKYKKKTRLEQLTKIYCWLCPQAIISWAFYQSASLLLVSFANRFAAESRKSFWLGMIGLLIIYSVSQAGFCWLNNRFSH